MSVNEPKGITEMRKDPLLFQTPPDGGEVKKGPLKIRIDSKIFFNIQFFVLDLPETLQEHLAVVEIGPAHSSTLKVPWAVYLLPKYKGLSILTPEDISELESCKTRTKVDEFFEVRGGMRADIV